MSAARYEEALAWFDRAAATDERHGELHPTFMERAHCLYELRRYDDAVEAMRLARPFYQDDRRRQVRWENNHAIVAAGWRRHHAVQAAAHLRCGQGVDLTGALFVVVHAGDVDPYKGDCDLGPPWRFQRLLGASVGVQILEPGGSRDLVLLQGDSVVGTARYASVDEMSPDEALRTIAASYQAATGPAPACDEDARFETGDATNDLGAPVSVLRLGGSGE